VPQRTWQARTWQARLTAHQESAGTDDPGRVGRQSPDQPAGQHASTASSRLTARGAGLAMLSVFFPGTLAAGWLHLTALTGVSFLAGCVIAGLYTKRADLLVVVTMPPMIFLIAVICVKAITATGNTVLSTAEGCILTMSSVAPWLFGGVAAVLFIALFRGLPQTVSEFRAALRGHLDSDDAGYGYDPGDAQHRR
jgi:hypothetical protein